MTSISACRVGIVWWAAVCGLCLSIFPAIPGTQASESDSPTLEMLPAPSAPTTGLPAPATWPVLRHERRLRFLAVLQQREHAAPYQRIARRCNAALELSFQPSEGKHGPDPINTLSHTNDKWIEVSKDPSAQEVADHAKARLRERLAARTSLPYRADESSVPERAQAYNND